MIILIKINTAKLIKYFLKPLFSKPPYVNDSWCLVAIVRSCTKTISCTEIKTYFSYYPYGEKFEIGRIGRIQWAQIRQLWK